MCKETVSATVFGEVEKGVTLNPPAGETVEISDIGKEWLAALRSGKYKQTKSVLKGRQGHCCLGVLGEIAVKKDVARWEGSSLGTLLVDAEHSENSNQFYATSSRTVLPRGVSEWSGVSQSGSPLPMSGKLYSLANLNDVQKYTFDQIADVLEGNPVAYGIDKK